jgi:hypothetical protein
MVTRRTCIFLHLQDLNSSSTGEESAINTLSTTESCAKNFEIPVGVCHLEVNFMVEAHNSKSN